MTTTFPRGAAVALATVTRPSKGIFLLSMHNLPDNRLTPEYIKHSLLPALDEIELEFRENYAKGNKEAALVLTGERTKNKFFSNGLSLELVVECPGFFKDYYYTLMSRLLTFPMHTVAAVNGHCFAGGFCLALCADWRISKDSPTARALWAMNEVNFGAPIPIGMASVLKQRLRPDTLRDVMLTGKQYTAPQALAAGIIDEVVSGEGEDVITRGLAIAEANKIHASTGVLGSMKRTLYSSVLEGLLTDEGMGTPAEENDARHKELLAQKQRDAKL